MTESGKSDALGVLSAHAAFPSLPPRRARVRPPPDALYPYPPDTVPALAGDVVVRAVTEWAYVDAASGRPRRIPAEIDAACLQDGA